MNIPLLDVLAAQHLILDAALLHTSILKSFKETVGYFLADELTATQNLPSFINSAMDGFIIRPADVKDLPFNLTLGGEISAGITQLPNWKLNTCLRIMTGAPLPQEELLIVPIEWTTQNGNEITFHKVSEIGQFNRGIGEDITIGQVIGQPFKQITPFDMGLWASLGITQIPVYPKPKVIVFSTGDEVISPEFIPQFGQIRNANLYALSAQVIESGGEVVAQIHLKDNTDSIQEALLALPEADIWVFSGGVSMGKYDLIRPCLEALGWEAIFWKVAQRPGKPLAFGKLGKILVFGLPGNPVSSAICFDQYVRLAIRKMCGNLQPKRSLLQGILGETIEKPSDLHVFWRAKFVDGKLVSAGKQGSHVYSALQQTEVLVHLIDGISSFEEGTSVFYERITDVTQNCLQS